MSNKATIVGVLGERSLLLPAYVHEALAANSRAKYFFTLLQLARAHADALGTEFPELRRERELAGITDHRFDSVIGGSSPGPDGEYRLPLVRTIVERVFADLRAMIAPLRAAAPARFDEPAVASFERRLAALEASGSPAEEETISRDALTRLTSSERDHGDSAHLLVFDLHKAVDAVAASLATEELDGARAFGLAPEDRPLVAAFMSGLRQTAPLKFDHSGLGTTATRSGPVLIIENDIGETSAHVLVIHVEGLRLVVTSTDVHLQRLEFFRRLLDGHRVQWADLRSRSARELQDVGLFYHCVGTLEAHDREELARFLAHLGSRLVFLIDWNRARKTLRAFLPKRSRLELLDWAAEQGLGHSGFLALGGAQLVFDAMAAVIKTPLRFGERLDEVLGLDAATGFLRFVLRTASTGLREGRSRSLMRAELQAALARALRARGDRLLFPVAEHAAILVELARGVREQLQGLVVPREGADAARERAHRGDPLVARLRGLGQRIPAAAGYRLLIERADAAAGALEQAAFLWSLAEPETALHQLAGLGELAVEAAETWQLAVSSAERPDEESEPRLLAAVDRLEGLERQVDEANRGGTAALLQERSLGAKRFLLASQASSQLARAVEALCQAGVTLRERRICVDP